MSIIILDTETTGIPEKNRFGEYFSYKDIQKYDNSRVIQLSYQCVDINFNKVYDRNYLIKGVDEIKNSDIHGISLEHLNRKGNNIKDIIGNIFSDLKNCQVIICHNLAFDMIVLKSELFRNGYSECIDILNEKKLICSMRKLKDVVGIKNEYGKNKLPKLKEVYNLAFGTQSFEGEHDAACDVEALRTSLFKLKKDGVIDILHGVNCQK